MRRIRRFLGKAGGHNYYRAAWRISPLLSGQKRRSVRLGPPAKNLPLHDAVAFARGLLQLFSIENFYFPA